MQNAKCKIVGGTPASIIIIHHSLFIKTSVYMLFYVFNKALPYVILSRSRRILKA